jgi:HSP20 family protein
MAKEKKVLEANEDKVPIVTSGSDRENEEFSRLMDTYTQMANPWVLPTVRLPLFPYWRDVEISLPSVDVVDYGDRYEVTAELPGYEKEDVEVTVNGFSLKIDAERNLVGDEGKSKNYIQHERLHSSYHRLVEFPQEITPSKTRAVLRSGLLEIDVPKITRESRSRKITVQ